MKLYKNNPYLFIKHKIVFRKKLAQFILLNGIIFINLPPLTNIFQTEKNIPIINQHSYTIEDNYNYNSFISHIEINHDNSKINQETTIKNEVENIIKTNEVVIIENENNEKKEKIIQITEEEKYIKKYSQIYGLNYDVVLNKAKELTDNFSSPDYLETYNINGSQILWKERKYDSKELGLLIFTRTMYYRPENFNLTKEETRNIEDTYVQQLEYKDMVKYYCKLFGQVEPELCMAIICSESGPDLSTKAFNEKNNPAGLMESDGNTLATFRNKEAGLIELISLLNYKYMLDKELYKLDPIDAIKKIRESYAPDNVKNDPNCLNKNWIKNVTYYYNLFKENNYFSNKRSMGKSKANLNK